MSAVPAQAASKPAVSRLSATAAPLTVLRHNTVTIAGTVTPRGTGVVKLERYLAGKWVQLAHKSTSKTGSYSFAFKTSGTLGTTIYRVTRSASSTARAAVSKTMHVHVVTSAYKVKAAAHSTVASATPIVVTGSVSPKVKGTVRLEVLQHGAWHAIASAALSASSTYSLRKVEPTGAYAVRVRSPLTTTIASGVSPTVKVTVAAPAAPPDTTKPTASFTLTGNLTSPDVYSGNVRVTINAADASGIKSITYADNGGTSQTYTGPFIVAGVGPQSLVAVVTDNAGNETSITASWTQQAGADSTA
ncbi:MAG: hypothetical protein QOF82_953, partial [Frankiales bacterium]|nr:hypothetical protein [Frankiales bacterium]